MGRPKKTEDKSAKEDKVDDIKVKKGKDVKFGLDAFLIPLSDLKEEQGKTYESITSLDIALGGGIPEGSSVLIAGSYGSGKTSLSLKYVEECHKVDPTKRIFFFDVEGRLRQELVDCYKGINKENFSVIKSNENKILTAEDYLNLLYSALTDYPHCICILDSVAALCPESEMATNIGDSVKMAGTASLMYKMFRKTSQILSVTKATYIALTHMIANPNPAAHGKRSITGGNAPQYQASIYLHVPYKKELTDSNNNTIGHLMQVVVEKSAMGPPGRDITIPIIYGEGISKELDVIDLCINAGLIEQKASWYVFQEQSYQGKAKLLQYVKDNPQVYAEIDDKLRMMALPNYKSKLKT